MLAALAFCWTAASIAQQPSTPVHLLDQIVVTGKKIKTDDEVTKQVEIALRADPYVLDDHVTITTKDGIVALHGLALDNWDVQVMKRIAKRMPGVRRVVDDVEVVLTGD
jgi:osmotically-inducible protein OsmY